MSPPLELNQSLPLSLNPVWRSYVGGSFLRQFRGRADTADDHFPEDWLASTVRARNGIHSRGDDEGLSKVRVGAQDCSLSELLSKNPELWGNTPRVGTGVLWKLLDSSVRLQIQAHPNEAFAQQHLNSNAGKTECWYILATRGDAYVYLGFQNAPKKSDWARMIREQQIDEMRSCFEKIKVRPGDCYVIPSGIPHAIGEGIFMLEMQEPTDWVVRCEFTTAGLTLPPDSCFMNLDLERCLDVFNYTSFTVDSVRTHFQQQPRLLKSETRFTEEEIVSSQYHHFFRLHRLRGQGDARWTGEELILLIVLHGKGLLSSGEKENEVFAGQTWLLPGCVSEWQWINRSNNWEILLAKLPIPRK